MKSTQIKFLTIFGMSLFLYIQLQKGKQLQDELHVIRDRDYKFWDVASLKDLTYYTNSQKDPISYNHIQTQLAILDSIESQYNENQWIFPDWVYKFIYENELEFLYYYQASSHIDYINAIRELLKSNSKKYKHASINKKYSTNNIALEIEHIKSDEDSTDFYVYLHYDHTHEISTDSVKVIGKDTNVILITECLPSEYTKLEIILSDPITRDLKTLEYSK